MAEGILKSVLDRAGKREQYNVYSRGAAAFDGDAASENALLACAEYGVDISAHRSKRLTVYDVERADKIFVMTEGIKNAIISAVPSAAKKIETLSVGDPFRQSLDVYKKCAKTFAKIFEERFAK